VETRAAGRHALSRGARVSASRCHGYLGGTFGHQIGAGVTGTACAAVLLVGLARDQHHYEGLTPEISREPQTQRQITAPAPPWRTLSAQSTRSRARASLSTLIFSLTLRLTRASSQDRLGR
jgi:hypothetical protein